ncbi:sensor histidine kinase [Tenacibaculum xiamenense]|uniref:sensor histidine kinase n=1 Tax=Tenacibaculum xiamenense TaxID=1261553 RepID=UPI003892F9F5
MIRYLSNTVFLFLVTTIYAQSIDYLSYQITQEEGLPDREIYSILEDNSGLIWLASNSGLFSFDGKSFKHYKHPKQRKSAVFSPQIDSKGRLWYCNLSGQIFYIQGKKVVFFDDYNYLIKNTVANYTVTDDYLFLTTRQSVLKVDINSKNKEEIFLKRKGKVFASSKVINTNEEFYITDARKIYNVDELLDVTIVNEERFLEYIKIISKPGKIITQVRLFNHLNEFRVLNKQNKFIPLSGTKELERVTILNIKFLNDKLWVLTSDGAYECQISNNNIKIKSNYLKGYSISDVLIDSNDNIWFSSLSSGLFVIPDKRIKRLKRLHENEYVSNVKPINDSVIFYVEGKKYFVKNNLSNSTLQLNEIKRLNNQKIYYDSYLEKCFFFNDHEALIYDKDRLIPFRKANKLGIKDIVRVNENTYWTTRYSALQKVNSVSFKKEERVVGRCNRILYNDFNDYLYVDFYGGLKAGNDPNHLRYVLDKGKKIFVKAITNQVESRIVWVAFDNKIVAIEDGDILKVVELDKKYSVLCLSSSLNNLWIGTNKGVLRLDFNSEKVYSLTRLNTTFQPIVREIQTTTNYTFVATDKYIYRIPNNHTEHEVFPNTPYFKTLSIDDKKMVCANNSPIELYKSSGSVEVNFTINGFKSHDYHKIEYRLKNGPWRTISGDNLLISNLSFGEQVLEVRGTNSEGNISETNELVILVHKPFYFKWWFLSLLIVFVVVVLIFFVKFLLKKLEERKNEELYQIEIQKQLADLKLENLRSQMNPHFIFNALNSIQEYIYNNNQKKASSYLVKFSRLIRMYLDHSKTSEISLQNEIEALELYLQLESNRMGGELEYSVHIKELFNLRNIIVPSLFIQPYVENSIKHGLLHKKGEKKIKVAFFEKEENLYCIVEDNGVGREVALKFRENKVHTSFSTKANIDRVALINSTRNINMKVEIEDLKNKEGIALGTKIIITIPLKIMKNESTNH